MNLVIIGVNSAVAQAVAHSYAAQAARIFCIARDADKLAQWTPQLGAAYAGSYCFDFTQQQQQAAIQAAVDTLGHIDIALIAHGLLPDQLRSESDIRLVEETFASNCLSVIAFLIPLCAQLKKQAPAMQKHHGKIGVITSVAGMRGRPRNFTYGAAKGALSIYLQGLRSSLYHDAIDVYDFRMGPVDTPMTEDHEKNFSFTTVDKAAEIIVKSFAGKRYTRYVPGFWFWVMLAVRAMPEAVFQRLGFLSAR